MTAPRQQPEPTRDEIREACEAVPGWEWDESLGHAWDPNPGGERRMPRFMPALRSDWDGDALDLLVATGEGFEISYAPGTRHPWAVRRPRWAHTNGPTLRAAAVRAVLAWARSKR